MNRAFSTRCSLYLVAAIGFASVSVAEVGSDPNKAETGKPVDAKAQASDIQRFCANNGAAVADARISWQTARLADLDAQIRQRIQDLEARQLEYVAWLRKRDEVMRRAVESVVAIYARMRPDAAASQLAAMDDEMAAAVLSKLPSRSAGVILNEMEAGRAAKLTRGMVSPDAAKAEKKS